MRPEHRLSLFRWAQAGQELNDELRDYVQRKTEEDAAQGMTRVGHFSESVAQFAHFRAHLKRLSGCSTAPY